MPFPTNEPFNIALVKAVEKFRCLYDTSIPQYSSKDEQDAAWTIVAEDIDTTGIYLMKNVSAVKVWLAFSHFEQTNKPKPIG